MPFGRCPVWKASRLADGAVTSVRTWKSGVSASQNSIFLRSGNEGNEVTQTPEELKARLLHCEWWNIAELVKGFCVEMPFFSVRKACSLTGTQGGLLYWFWQKICHPWNQRCEVVNLEIELVSGAVCSIFVWTRCLASGQLRPGPRLWKCRPSMTLRSSIGFKNTWPWGYRGLLLSICVEQVVRIQSVAPSRMFLFSCDLSKA